MRADFKLPAQHPEHRAGKRSPSQHPPSTTHALLLATGASQASSSTPLGKRVRRGRRKGEEEQSARGTEEGVEED